MCKKIQIFLIKTFFIIATVTFCIILFSACSSAQNKSKKNSENTLLWQVKSLADTNKIIYLLGSIHIGTKEIYPLSPIIIDSWRKSNVLGVEVNIENLHLDSNDFDFIFKLISLTDKLDSKLPPEIYEKVKKKLIEIGLPEEQINSLTPLGATLFIEMGDILKSTINNENSDKTVRISYGIDQYFINLASEENKKIIEVESLERQIKVFEEMDEFIVEYLQSLLKKSENNPSNESINSLLTAWKNGDIETIEQSINAPFSDDKQIDLKLKNILLYKRNFEIAQKIESYILSPETHFIVIGAGHFVGEKSIIDILSKTKKYIIKRL